MAKTKLVSGNLRNCLARLWNRPAKGAGRDVAVPQRRGAHRWIMGGSLAVLALAVAVEVLPVQAQEEATSGVTLESGSPGTLAISWDVPDQVPSDYRVNWAKSSEKFPSWRDDHGNAYPTTNSHTVSDLDEGAEYKVQVRARYRKAGKIERLTPWSETARITIASQPEATSGVTLESGSPGTLAISWDVPGQVPSDYRVNWAKSSEKFPSWRDDHGNAYPTTNSHTVSNLDEGVEYKVQVRARYRKAGKTENRTPWSETARITIASQAGDPTPEPTATPEPTTTPESPTPEPDPNGTRLTAVNLGNIAPLFLPSFLEISLDGDPDRINYFRFSLAKTREVNLRLLKQDANADLFLEDVDGNVIYSRTRLGTANEKVVAILSASTYYIRVEAQEKKRNDLTLRYGVARPPSISIEDAEANESDAEVRFSVTLDYAPPGTITVDYSTANGTAVSGEDYRRARGTLTFSTSETQKTVTVAVIDDQLEDSGEMFTLTLRNPSDGTLKDASAIGTILDDDDLLRPKPLLTVSDAEAYESDEEIVFTFALDNAPWEAASVAYATVDGTANAGEDYEASSGTVTFATNETEKTVTVNVIDDHLEDTGETFTIILSNPSGVFLSDTEATGTIWNTDDFPADSTTQGSVVVGSSRGAHISPPGDLDWIWVRLIGNRTYRIDVRQGGFAGDFPGGRSVPEPEVHRIISAADRVVYHPGTDFEHEDEKVDLVGDFNIPQLWYSNRYWFRPTETGFYYLEIGSRFPDDDGGYTVWVAQALADHALASIETRRVIEVDGDSVIGVIGEPRDVDWFRVQLSDGVRYTITLSVPTGVGWSYLSDPAIKGVMEEDGILIPGTEKDSSIHSGKETKTFTASDDGTHYIAVGGGTNATGHYVLKIVKD